VTQPVWDAVSMADGWRVELDVEDHDAFHRALDRLRERGGAREARHSLPAEQRLRMRRREDPAAPMRRMARTTRGF
jgi:hypothetical protein